MLELYVTKSIRLRFEHLTLELHVARYIRLPFACLMLELYDALAYSSSLPFLVETIILSAYTIYTSPLCMFDV